MIRLWAAAFVCGIFIGVAALCGCASNNDPPAGQPTFYQSLSSAGAKLDANAAQSMISGYRSNNGLGPVVIDSELMQLANEQARAMAARDKLDHSVSKPFQERL